MFCRKSQFISDNDIDLETREINESRISGTYTSVSYFTLILNSHRLMYVRQGINPPGTEAFENTIKNFVKKKHSIYVAQRSLDIENEFSGFDAFLGESNRILVVPTSIGDIEVQIPRFRDIEKFRSVIRTNWRIAVRKAVRSLVPEPTLDITPLADEEELSAFVNRAAVIKSVKIRVTPRNSETDGHNLVNELLGYADETHAQEVTQTHSTDAPEGLDKEGTLAVASGVGSGNSEFEIKAVMPDDPRIITKTTRDIRLKVTLRDDVEPLRRPPVEIAREAIEHHERQVENETISEPRPEEPRESTLEKLRRLIGFGN